MQEEDQREQVRLIEIARRKANELGGKEDVLAVGVTGSLAAERSIDPYSSLPTRLIDRLDANIQHG